MFLVLIVPPFCNLSLNACSTHCSFILRYLLVWGFDFLQRQLFWSEDVSISFFPNIPICSHIFMWPLISCSGSSFDLKMHLFHFFQMFQYIAIHSQSQFLWASSEDNICFSLLLIYYLIFHLKYIILKINLYIYNITFKIFVFYGILIYRKLFICL
jgi:hypothetical protein